MSAREALERAFGPAGGPVVEVRAPGRVNLIGEHTDYNDGFVLPMAIEAGLDLAGRARGDRLVRLHAADLGQSVSFDLDAPLARDPAHPWAAYPTGVLWALQRAGVPLRGVDLAFGGDLPQGAGLSSSAALEVAAAVALRALLGLELPDARLALLCQQAEGSFVGLQCGIMDQWVVVHGRAGHALFLDCRSLAFEQVPLALSGHAVAICHSGVKHSLVGSEYNRRRQECAEGVRALQARYPLVRALRDATLAQLEACQGDLPEVVLRRCRHVVTEDARVLDAAAALRAGDLPRFGALMNASHDSLRDDYEVSCPEVDLLVRLARGLPGVLGARITGGGFGGCTVNLIAREAVPAFEARVMRPYEEQTGVAPRLFVSAPADGARVQR